MYKIRVTVFFRIRMIYVTRLQILVEISYNLLPDSILFFFFLNEPATPEISPLPQHALLPICSRAPTGRGRCPRGLRGYSDGTTYPSAARRKNPAPPPKPSTPPPASSSAAPAWMILNSYG